MKKLAMTFGIAVACAGLAWGQAAQGDLSTELRKLVDQNFAMYQAENMDGVMATMHSKSPIFDSAREMLDKIFKDYDLRYEVVGFAVMGTDDEYAAARVKQSTTKVKGPEFKDNVIDSLYVFRKESGAWKLWSQVILETQLLMQSPADK